MFEAAELGRRIGKPDFEEQAQALRVVLLRLQYELRESDFSVVVVIDGVDGFGANETSNVLHEWMDARHLQAHAFGAPTDEERQRPLFWRYWRALPPAGSIGVFMREWTWLAVVDRVVDEIDDAGLERRLRHIAGFERAVVDDGAVVVKFWLHLPKAELKRRLKAWKADPPKAWRVDRRDRLIHKHYDRGMPTVERVLRRTSTGRAPWHIVDSADARYRTITVAQTLVETLAKRFERRKTGRGRARVANAKDPVTILDDLDLSASISKKAYDKQLARYQAQLSRLSARAYRKGVPSVFVFEGWDAAGKGGAIRRLTRAIDAARYRVIPVAAPTDEEGAHHYLWRFWRYLPRAGHMAFFDRSWYGRVLVERVEGFATEREWMRAYAEINDFEEQLREFGGVLLKFWVHVDADEQLRRFKAREKTPFKKYKMTAEDYRNRARRPEYEAAANEMIERTSTEYARWHLVAGNDKRWARIRVIETVCERLEAAL